MPSIHVRQMDGSETVHALEGQSVSFGRAADGNLVLDARGVSRRHGRFVLGPAGRWYVEDLGSTNGVLVGGEYVTRQVLRDGDVLTVGELTLTFRTDVRRPMETIARTITIADTPLPRPTVERSAGTMSAIDGVRLTALYEITRRLLDCHDVEGLVDEASRALLSVLEAEVVALGLTRDPEQESDRVLVRSKTGEGVDLRLSRSILRRTIDGRRAILVADTWSDYDLVQAHSIVAGGINSALCVPMMRGDDVTGFIYVDSRRRGRSYSDAELEFACAVGAVVGTAIENARLHEAELVKQRMEAELASARQVQQAILPSGTWPSLDGWAVYGMHRTSREVGGDYYDAVVTSGDNLWLMVADVAGKGVPAALLSSSMHAAFHSLVDRCSTPAELLGGLNRLLLRRDVDQRFVTCLVVLVRLRTGEASIASAGHPHPVYVGEREPGRQVIVDNGLILGIQPDVEYADTVWLFPAGQGALLLFTDGLTETMNAQGEIFGESRLCEAVGGASPPTAETLVNHVRAVIDGYRGESPPTDDLTLLACERCG